MLAAAIVPGLTVFPQIAWRWESETDILSGTYRTPRRGESAETVELSSLDGAVAVLDVVNGEVCGLDIVIWPDVDTVTGLRPPGPQVAGRVTLPPADAPRQIEEPLAVTVDGLEQTFHLRIGPERPVTVVQVADHLLIEVDASDQLAGFWLTGVPPFPSEE
jgi:hypothetical protein